MCCQDITLLIVKRNYSRAVKIFLIQNFCSFRSDKQRKGSSIIPTLTLHLYSAETSTWLLRWDHAERHSRYNNHHKVIPMKMKSFRDVLCVWGLLFNQTLIEEILPVARTSFGFHTPQKHTLSHSHTPSHVSGDATLSKYVQTTFRKIMSSFLFYFVLFNKKRNLKQRIVDFGEL